MTHDIAAGGKPPAALVRGPVWRDRRDVPIYSVKLWPNRSLTRGGFRTVFGISTVFLAAPLLAVSGTPAFWGLAPFIAGALWLLWYGVRRNNRDLEIVEDVWIWRDEVRVERREPSGRILRWQADPLRVRLRLHGDATIEEYLTLAGGGREIELGAFLAPEERVALAGEIEAALTRTFRV